MEEMMNIPLKRPGGTRRGWSCDSTGRFSLSLGSFLLAGLLIFATRLWDIISEAGEWGRG